MNGTITNCREKSEHQLAIEEMLNLIAQYSKNYDYLIPDTPCMPTDDVRKTRAGLILEEAFETIKALGYAVSFSSDMKLELVEMDPEPDMAEIAKELADLSVVTIGTLSAFGLADKQILKLVDENNLQKFTSDGKWDESRGKWIKPPNHKKPDMYIAIDDQYKKAREVLDEK